MTAPPAARGRTAAVTALCAALRAALASNRTGSGCELSWPAVPLSARSFVIDNDQVAHGDALRYLLADTPVDHALAMGTGYVNLDGLHVLADAVSANRAVRLQLGAAPRPGLDAVAPPQRFVDQLAVLRGNATSPDSPESRRCAPVPSGRIPGPG